MKTYRVAVLGCRMRGAAAARAYHAHPRTKVVALCDLLQERLDAFGDELGVSARYTDLDVMIGESSPDIVAISTGTEFHFDLSMGVLGAWRQHRSGEASMHRSPASRRAHGQGRRERRARRSAPPRPSRSLLNGHEPGRCPGPHRRPTVYLCQR